PVPREGAGRHPRPAAPPRRSGLVRLLRHGSTECRRDRPARPRSARGRGRRPGAGVPHAGRYARRAGRGILHRRPGPHRADRRGGDTPSRGRPDRLRRCARRSGGGGGGGGGGGSGGSGERPLLTAPTHAEVLTYWTRAGFFREAGELFEIHGKVPRVKAVEESDVLLPVTSVRAAEDVHAVVSNIQQRASAILASELGLDPKATMGFAMALSEACQNIVEHAGTGGWVAVQAYHWRRKL